MNFYSLFLIFILCTSVPLQEHFVSLKENEMKVWHPKNEINVLLSFQILPGYHIQAENEVPENIIPTTISFDNTEAFSVLEHNFIISTYDEVILDRISHKVISNDFQVSIRLKPVKEPKDHY